MEVSNSLNIYSNQQIKRETAADIAGHKSKQDQINAYVQGSNNTQVSTENNSTKAYVEFSEDVRKADAYETFIENDFKPSEQKEEEGSIHSISKPFNEAVESVVKDVNLFKTKDSDDISFKTATESIKDYNDLITKLKRPEQIKTYQENNFLV